MPKRADRRHLLDVAYADDTGLAARKSLYEYQHPRVDLQAEALALLGDVRGTRVVDVGCGNGYYLAALSAAGAVLVGSDLSAGMLAGVPPPRPPLLVADAQALPFPDEAVDVVLMTHMLYHLPEPGDGVAEARRVLRTPGRLLIATIGTQHLAEMNELWLPLLDEAGVLGDVQDIGLVNGRLAPDVARRLLEASFPVVTERLLRSAVIVDHPGPVVRHAASTTAAHVSAEQGKDLVDQFTARVESVIDRDGEFRVTTEVAMFLAESPR